ncbi:pyridoxamine 5'-phosphate oxidase family protein [Acidobacteriota bacterium]
MKKLYLICISVLLFSFFVLPTGNTGQIPSKTDVINLILSYPADRIVTITTVNPDNSPHMSTVGIFVQNGLIKFRASGKIAVARNLQRTKKAIITLYKMPEEPLPLSQHSGARVWVKLLADKIRDEALMKGESIKSIYSMEIVKIAPLHESSETQKEDNKNE